MYCHYFVCRVLPSGICCPHNESWEHTVMLRVRGMNRIWWLTRTLSEMSALTMLETCNHDTGTFLSHSNAYYSSVFNPSVNTGWVLDLLWKKKWYLREKIVRKCFLGKSWSHIWYCLFWAERDCNWSAVYTTSFGSSVAEFGILSSHRKGIREHFHPSAWRPELQLCILFQALLSQLWAILMK